MKKIIKDEMDIVFLLDRSGSMGGVEEDTIGGYNSYIDNQKGNNVKITTILFDDKYEVLTDRENINNIDKLTRDDYFVRGSTALMDAIGKSINYMDRCKSKKAMFIITTDGYENSSKEYSKDKIKKMKRSRENTRKNTKGISTLFGAVAKASSMMCNEESLDCSWKQELDSYIKENS